MRLLSGCVRASAAVMLVSVSLVPVVAQAPRAKGIEGNWEGTIDAGAMKLRMGLHLTRNSEGLLIAKLDSIDQGVNGIPVPKATFEGQTLKLDLANMRASYEGALSASGNEINGMFLQGGKVPLNFKRVDQVTTIERKQTPKPPFPYESVDVSYENKRGGVRLGGTLTIPKGAGPHPAVILITGSGAQDRDETIFGHKPFLVLADMLTRRGFAALRLDDRGVGKTTGSLDKSTIEDLAGDVLAGIEFLKSRSEIDAKQIGLMGHSEGGIIGPLVASKSKDVAFLVMLAGTGVPIEQILYLQAELISRASGVPEVMIAQNRRVQSSMFAVVKEESDPAKAAEKLRAGWAEMKASLPEAAQKDAAMSDQNRDQQISMINSPGMRFLLVHDPAKVLKLVSCPVLVINGELDLQVPPHQNLPPIVAALAEGKNSDFTIVKIPHLNHLLQTSRTGSVSEYGSNEETIAPAALDVISTWLTRHAQLPKN